MIVALQQVQNHPAKMRGRFRRRGPRGRSTDAGRVPDLHHQSDRAVPAGRRPLHDYGFYVIRPALSRVPGVGHVAVLASDTREIEVIVDPAKMLASKLTVDDVSAALKGANLLQPVGHYPENGLQHLVLASGLWKSIDDIGNTPVVVKGGATLKVSDLATVVSGSPDRTSLIAGQNGNATAISVSQQVGANILEIEGDPIRRLTNWRAPAVGLQITKVYDPAESAARDRQRPRRYHHPRVGGFLAIRSLLLFLLPARLAPDLVAALTRCRVAVLMTFAVMHLFRRVDQPHVDGRPARRLASLSSTTWW